MKVNVVSGSIFLANAFSSNYFQFKI